MSNKCKSSISIIGGADGPTSIFVAGPTQKMSIRGKVRNGIYRISRKMAEKKVTADPHTLEEVVQYAFEHYHFAETDSTAENYMEQRKNLKESLIIQHKPEALGEMKDIPAPDPSDEESVKAFFSRLDARSRMIDEMPDDVISMDYHLFELRIKDDSLEMEIDFIWDIFAISYSGNKRTMKQFKKISNDLYLYYGVSEDDIQNRTQRYSSLLTALSS